MSTDREPFGRHTPQVAALWRFARDRATTSGDGPRCTCTSCEAVRACVDLRPTIEAIAPDLDRGARLIRYHLQNAEMSAGDRAELAALADFLVTTATEVTPA